MTADTFITRFLKISSYVTPLELTGDDGIRVVADLKPQFEAMFTRGNRRRNRTINLIHDFLIRFFKIKLSKKQFAEG
jgi:hypothetical protein